MSYEIGAAGGKEEALFQPRSGDTGATINRGLYGVNVEYQVRLENNGQETYDLDVYFRARSIPAKYFGAVDATPNVGIPPIGTGAGASNACVVVENAPIWRPIPNVILKNATAGACGMPVDLTLNWEVTS